MKKAVFVSAIALAIAAPMLTRVTVPLLKGGDSFAFLAEYQPRVTVEPAQNTVHYDFLEASTIVESRLRSEIARSGEWITLGGSCNPGSWNYTNSVSRTRVSFSCASYLPVPASKDPNKPTCRVSVRRHGEPYWQAKVLIQLGLKDPWPLGPL
jgi:hypothetical protein